MASQLVKQRWKIDTKFPDFFEMLENVAKHVTLSGKPKFSKYVNPVGIEIEVEGWRSPFVPLLWENREDGSLKDHGREFVSRILSGVLIDYALKEIEDIFNEHNKKSLLRWSHRTSIHVHVNLQELPTLKLKWLVAYYALTEPIWYSMCHPDRIGNSFCFPLCSINPFDVVPGRNWPKYCGLNLGSSLTTFNTVEFRHMHGNQDFDLYKRWITRICEFVDYIHKTPAKTLRLQMENYLTTGKVTFKEAFGGSLPPDVDKQIYDNAKWVIEYLHKD
jgi:hypothetical protein